MLLVALLASGLLSALLIVLLKPLLRRYALARPNARSSHRVPTPQGGGIAVLAAAVAVALAAAASTGVPASLTVAVIAAFGLALVGAVDDIRPLPAAPRLALQLVAVGAVVVASDLRIAPDLVPLWLERAVLVVAGGWFINLVNFMDGLDWITVAEMVPITAFLTGLGALGILPMPAALVAAGLCGALV